MNVWIWGPPMWDILHSACILSDTSKQSAVPLLRPLKMLLPCIFCRESFTKFYNCLGDPPIGLASEYLRLMHSIVNKKLSTQRLMAYVAKHTDWSTSHKEFFIKHTVLMDSDPTIKPFTEPTQEVLQKRFRVNREEPLTWKHLSVLLLAVVMGLQKTWEQANPLEASFQSTVMHSELCTLLNCLSSLCAISMQENRNALQSLLRSLFQTEDQLYNLDILQTKLVEAKYSTKFSSDTINLIRAGSCISGTCT